MFLGLVNIPIRIGVAFECVVDYVVAVSHNVLGVTARKFAVVPAVGILVVVFVVIPTPPMVRR